MEPEYCYCVNNEVLTRIHIHIYHILYCALQSYTGSRGAELKRPPWAPRWAPSWTCTAKLGCQEALGRQFGLPRRTWTPFWLPTGLQLGLQVPPGVPRTVNFARPYSTLATFSETDFCASQVLLDCLLAALGPVLGAFWAPLGASWAPLWLNLSSLGRL